MDDYFEDFDGDMDGDFNDDGDDGADFEDTPAESSDEYWDGPRWQDWAIIFPLSEEIAREKRDRDRIRRENDDADDDYWDMINRRW